MTAIAKKRRAAAPSRYRRVPAKLWDEPRFRKLSAFDRLVALLLMTGQATNRIGYFMLSTAASAETLGVSAAVFGKSLQTCCQTFGWYYDSDNRVLYQPDHFERNPPEGVNNLLGYLKDLAEVPTSDLLSKFKANVDALEPGYRAAFLEGIAKVLGEESDYPSAHPSPEQSNDPSAHPSETPAGLRNRSSFRNREAGTGTGAGERDALAHEAFEVFAERWLSRYRTRPDQPSAAQCEQIASLVAECGIDGFRGGVEAYFDAFDDYATDAKHPLGLFLKQFNRWAAEPTGVIQ